MSGGKWKEVELTKIQQQLVEENIGLVAVHLRRHVRNLFEPRSDREWEDLFQEGCLGLIQAAITYREDRGIPFAAFALPRIHNAVSRALQSKFSTVRMPATPSEGGGSSCVKPRRRRVQSLSGDLEHHLADKRRHEPGSPDRETIGHRLRGKYERAVQAAGDLLSRKPSTRGDRDKLVRILVQERFMVPHDEARRPLRQIARDTRSSYARVAQCDKQLAQAVGRILKADPEFRELTRHARTDPQGVDIPIDDPLECSLADTSAEEFMERFHSADARERARMLDALLAVSNEDVSALILRNLSRLPMRDRERLLWDAKAEG